MQELNGYIKLFRKLIRWGWYQDSVVKDLFLHCLICASYKDFEWMGMELKAGQFITGRKKLAEELGFSEQQIRTAIKKLESTGEITSITTNRYSIITVVNWENYQGDSNEQPTENAVFCEQIMNKEKNLENSTNKSTNKNDFDFPLNKGFLEIDGTKSTKSATNKQPTSNQQATNKQPHIKNIKNIKNIKKRENNAHAHARKALPSFELITSFANENGISEEIARKFFDYYNKRCWKTSHGTDVAEFWQDKLVEWKKKENKKPTTNYDKTACYDKELVNKLLNKDE